MIYLDNAATTFPKPKIVKNALVEFLENYGANARSSGHDMSIKSGRIIFETREKIANLVNLQDVLKVIFTSNATHSINIILHGILQKNDKVVCSPYEHNSTIRVLKFLEKKLNLDIEFLKLNKHLQIDTFKLKDSLKGAKLLCLCHANNVTGAILPIQKIFKVAKNQGVLTLLDAAQSLGVVQIDMQKDSIDFLCASGHKGLFGIQGTGVLCINNEHKITPLMQGGTGSKSEDINHPQFFPDILESGTQNAHGICSIKAGISFIESFGLKNILIHERNLKNILINELEKFSDIKVLYPPKEYESIANVSFVSKNHNPTKIARMLEFEAKILTRASLHCNPLTHKIYNTFPVGAVRMSLGVFNNEANLDTIISTLKKVLR